jgi:hypothetical protein
MKSRRSRLALLGVLALAISVTVGLVSGSVADAKKKGKRKGSNSVTIVAGPTVVPPSTPPPPLTPDTVSNRGIASVPLNVGKKAKGKVVSLQSVAISFQITGSPRANAGAPGDTPAAASEIGINLIAPNGRTVGVFNPGQFDENATTIGPVTVTPDSPFGVCSTTETGTNGETTICDVNDPNDVVRPPSYTGTVGDAGLALLGGVPARGTWTAQFRNFSHSTPATVTNFSAVIGLQAAPTA